jgi:hypothetical protein
MSATRILFRIAVAILWVFVALLAVEIFERARWALIERDAATYMSTRDYTIPGMRPATPEEAARIRENPPYLRQYLCPQPSSRIQTQQLRFPPTTGRSSSGLRLCAR